MKHIKLFENFDRKLINKKSQIAELLKKSELNSDELYPQDIVSAVNFIENGSPSEDYLDNILNKLETIGVDISNIK